MRIFFSLRKWDLSLEVNSCIHYFSIKSCVHICHARDKNIDTITVGFIVLKKYMSRFSMVLITSWTTALRHFRSTSGSIWCWNFLFQKFWLHQKIRREISRESLGQFLIFDPIKWLISSILSPLSRAWQIWTQVLKRYRRN